jgi:hypothetical protein
MTPKEKAIELVDKYWQLNYDWDGTTKEGWAKDGALIAVDEIIDSHNNDNKWYWNEVKQEIEKL